MRRNLTRLLLVIAMICLGCGGAGAARYSIAMAGISNPQGINNSGQIVGQYITGGVWSAAIWSPHGTTSLAPINNHYYSYAFDISDNGQVVGRSNGSGAYWASSTAAPVAILPGGNAQANGLNDSGEVTGYTTFEGASRAFYWKDGEATILDTLGGSSSWACNISNNGQVCGYADSATATMLPCVWQNGAITQLQLAPGYVKGAANQSNELGQIVGRSIQASGTEMACFWSSATAAPVSLGCLPGATSSQARGVNKFGQAVGLSYRKSSGGATLWENGLMYDLNSLIPANSGWTLEVCEGINDLGQIVGQGMYYGSQRTFVLTPVPEPSSLAVLFCGISAAGVMLRRRKR